MQVTKELKQLRASCSPLLLPSLLLKLWDNAEYLNSERVVLGTLQPFCFISKAEASKLVSTAWKKKANSMLPTAASPQQIDENKKVSIIL